MSEHVAERAEQWTGLVERLARLRSSGELRGPHVRSAAVRAGVSERTMRRWIAAGGPVVRERRMPELSPAEREAVLAAGGNVAAAFRTLRAEGVIADSERALRRRVQRDLLPGEWAFAREGVAGQRAHAVYLRWDPERRGQLYEADHKQLAIEVLAPRAVRPQRPWVTLVVDGYSRLVVGWAISLQPTQAEVLAALRAAVVADPDRGFGGICDVLRVDRGLEFAANAVADACSGLGVLLERNDAYHPWQKGKVERLNRTVDQTLLALLPRFADGPLDANGKLLDQSAPLALQEFCARFAAWVDDYHRRGHSGLDGQTPLERWVEDPFPVATLEPERARWLLLAGEQRRVNKDGIHFRGQIYIAPELHGRVGERLDVRFMPHDPRSIELYRDGRWLATALPQQTLTAAERDALLQTRQAQLRRLKRDLRRARRAGRRRLAPITGADEPEDITLTGTPGAGDALKRPVLRLLDLGECVDGEQDGHAS